MYDPHPGVLVALGFTGLVLTFVILAWWWALVLLCLTVLAFALAWEF